MEKLPAKPEKGKNKITTILILGIAILGITAGPVGVGTYLTKSTFANTQDLLSQRDNLKTDVDELETSTQNLLDHMSQTLENLDEWQYQTCLEMEELEAEVDELYAEFNEMQKEDGLPSIVREPREPITCSRTTVTPASPQY